MRSWLALLFLLTWTLVAAGAPIDLRGVVHDPAGAAVEGAAVRLFDSEQNELSSTVTAIDGSFRIRATAPGSYTLTVSAPEFEKRSIPVTVSKNLQPLAITLPLALLAQQVTVEGERPIDVAPEANHSAITLDAEALWDLPTMGNDPIAAATEFIGDGALSTGGVTLIVDGMESDELNVSASAVAEVRINKNPFSAEYSRPGRSRIEVITRQATRDYHGSISTEFRDSRLDARNAFALDRPDQRRRGLEGSLSGPLGAGGRRYFLISGEYEQDRRQNIVYALTPSGIFQATQPNPSDEVELSARVAQRCDRHQYSLQGEWERSTASGEGAGGLALPETAISTYEQERDLRFAHTWLATPAFLTEFQARLRADTDTASGASLAIPRISVDGAFETGSAQVDDRRSRYGVDVRYTMTWSSTKHLVRAGVFLDDLERYRYENRDNFGGSWRFASLSDYQAGRALAFTRRAGAETLSFFTAGFAAFLQDDWRLTDRITIGLGLRYDLTRWLDDSNNLSPRASIAWSPDENRHTVIRAGGGLFYDSVSTGEVSDLLWLANGAVEERLATDVLFVSGEPSGYDLAPGGRVRWSPAIKSPYRAHFSLSLERRLNRMLSASIEYEGTRGIGLLRSRDLNPPLPPVWIRPTPTLAWVRQLESSGRSRTDRFEFAMKAKTGSRADFMVRYGFGWSKDNVDGSSSLPPDSLDLSSQWGFSDYDRRHRLQFAGRFAIWNGWSLGAIFRASSGQPYDITQGVDVNRDGSARERPPGVERNSLREPSYARADVRLNRRFRLMQSKDSKTALAISFDAFNVLNRVNITRVVGNLRSPLFGRPVASDSARRLQLTARFSF